MHVFINLLNITFLQIINDHIPILRAHDHIATIGWDAQSVSIWTALVQVVVELMHLLKSAYIKYPDWIVPVVIIR